MRIAGRVCLQSERRWHYDPKLGLSACPGFDHGRRNSEALPAFDKPLLVFEQQKYPSEREMLEQAIRQTFAGLAQINRQERSPAPLSKLCIGTECGASDGFSGISANPTIGRVADLLVGIGGRVILSEFPELCGVEQEIVNRCAMSRNRKSLH